jgi:hypothetical protein
MSQTNAGDKFERRESVNPMHTHLVRGGFLMLQPTAGAQHVLPTMPVTTYPPRQRWVPDVVAYIAAPLRSLLKDTQL